MMQKEARKDKTIDNYKNRIDQRNIKANLLKQTIKAIKPKALTDCLKGTVVLPIVIDVSHGGAIFYLKLVK